MRTSTKLAIAVAAAAGLALAIPGLATAAAMAYQNVIVANDSSKPIPTTAVGTTPVSGTVNVGGGSVNIAGGSVGISGPVDASGSSVTIGNTASSPVPVTVENQAATAEAQPWQASVPVLFWSEGDTATYGSGFLNVTTDDGPVTIERVSAEAPDGNQIIDMEVHELCDFTDGKNGYGGSANIPLPPSAPSANQNIDHPTQLHVTQNACAEVTMRVQNSLPTNRVVYVTLSGISVPASSQSSQEAAGTTSALRSLDDPQLRGVLTPQALAAARASLARQAMTKR
jgi:hypothetical protein